MFKKQPKDLLMNSGALFLFILSIMGILGIIAVIMSLGFLGQGNRYNNTITVTGKGEVFATPDIATIGFSVREEAQDAATAQNTVTEKVSGILDQLSNLEIADKDIKTVNYSTNPRYEWTDGSRELRGYEVTQSIDVKVRATENLGEVLAILGQANATNINGPRFEIDDMSELETTARQDAIEDARSKAEELTKGLGVKLGKVVDFYEDQGGYYPEPMYARAYDSVGSADMFMEESALPNVDVPLGEDSITARVTVTYKIK